MCNNDKCEYHVQNWKIMNTLPDLLKTLFSGSIFSTLKENVGLFVISISKM